MDKMHTELTAAAENVEYSPALQAALTLGKNLLNKYYSLSDDSEIYRIAIGMYYWISFQTFYNIIISASPTSETQTQILREAEMGEELDQNGRRNCPGGI